MNDFPIVSPPIPQPNLFPDEGVPPIPFADVYQQGSIGGEVLDYGNSAPIIGGPDAPDPYNILIVHSDGTEELINTEDVLADYDGTSDDNWSITITVSSGATQSGAENRSYNATDTGFYDNTGSSQTKAIIPIYRNQGYVANTGVYRATILCVNGSSVVQFIKQ